MPILKPGMCPNLTKTVIQLLEKEGIKDVINFVGVDVEKLAKSSGISYKVICYSRVSRSDLGIFP